MKAHYFVIVEKEKDSCYGVYSPDFKTVISAGDTFKEACRNMQKAMEIYLAEVDIVPKATSIEKIENYIIENYPAKSIKTIVDLEVSLPNPRAVRINISMPEDILYQLDKQLEGKTNQRSRFITHAVEKELMEA